MKRLLALAASRPVVAWYLGYAPFLLVLTGIVALQNGWRAAGIAAVVNAALMAVPVGAVWAATALLARSGRPRSWGIERALGVALGILATAVAGALVVWAFIGEGPRSALVLPGEPTPPAWVGALTAAALIVALNVVPLALGVAIEAAARISAGRRAA